jgi:hypothetical protein
MRLLVALLALGTMVEPEAEATSEADTPSPPQQVGADELILEPEGPYRDGQLVTVWVDGDSSIDVYNENPRLCAVVDDESERCDPRWIAAFERPQTSTAAPKGVLIALSSSSAMR